METLKVPFMQLELVLKKFIIDSYRKSKYVGIKIIDWIKMIKGIDKIVENRRIIN